MPKGKKKKKNVEKQLRESAYKIWLAGLGALAAAEEGGSKLFHSLVAKGRELEEGPVARAKDKVKGTVDEVRASAGKTLESIESSLDARIVSTLERMGVPTREEIDEVAGRIDRLAAAVGGEAPGKKKKRAAKKPGKRGARKAKNSRSRP